MINYWFHKTKRNIKRSLFFLLEKAGLMRILYRILYRPKVLMYHRVNVEPFSDISPSDLDLHLEFLCKHFSIIPLREFVELSKLGQLKRDALAITFDDGYKDFYTYAFNSLNKFNVNSTLFVSTDFVESRFWMWPDQIKYYLGQSSVDVIKIKERKISIDDKIAAWHLICDFLLELPPKEIELLISEIRAQLLVDAPETIPECYKSVTWEQLREIQESGHAIESHTVSHSRLNLLSKNEIDIELDYSKKRIDKELKKQSSFICFPFGRPQDISEYVISSAKKHKYIAGFYSCDVKSDQFDNFMFGRVGAQPKLCDLAFSVLRGKRCQ